MSYRNKNRSSASDSLRLNYLYPTGDMEDYGRKLYIFSSVPAQSTEYRHGRNAAGFTNRELSPSLAHGDRFPPSTAEKVDGGGGLKENSDTNDLRQRVYRLQQLLRAERESLREREDTVASLRRIVDEHERRVHHMDGVDGGVGRRIGTIDLVRISPTQKLLDQVQRLQQQKSELLIKLAEYEEMFTKETAFNPNPTSHSDAVNNWQPANITTTASSSTVNTITASSVPMKDEQPTDIGLSLETVNSGETVNSATDADESDNSEISERSLEGNSGLEERVHWNSMTATTPASVSEPLPVTTSIPPVTSTPTASVWLSTSPQKNVSENTSNVPHPLQQTRDPLVRGTEETGRIPNKGNQCRVETATTTTVCVGCKNLSAIMQELESAKKQLAAKDEQMKIFEATLRQEKETESRERVESLTRIETEKDLQIQQVHSEMTGLKSKILTVYRQFQKLRCVQADLAGSVRHSLREYQMDQDHVTRTITNTMSDVCTANDHVMSRYLKEMQLRQNYHNQLVELRGNIRVMCRVRPCIKADGPLAEDNLVVTLDPDDEGLIRVSSKGRLYQYDLDKAFGMNTSQAKIFEEVSSLVRSTVDGFNVCIFAYGQTGSGKTYTMQGTPSDPGIQQRALEQLFKETGDLDWNYSISASVLEIYNETILDLLTSEANPKLEVKLHPEGDLRVPGLTEVPVTSLEEMNQIFESGQRQRSTECTNMNEHSSRSHCLLRVYVQGQNLITGRRTSGLLTLVDLAGSERLSKTQANGDRLREAQNINRSLACLGNVMHALRTRQRHVPYRNSKLTYLMRDSLGGDSKTLMIVQVAPADNNVRETLCTLTFGQRVKDVELGPATRNLQRSPTSPTLPVWTRPASLDLSFSSTSSTSPPSSPSASPYTSPFPSPCSSPSPTTNKYPKRTLSTTSTSTSRRRKLPSSGCPPRKPLSASFNLSSTSSAARSPKNGNTPTSLLQKEPFSPPALSTQKESPVVNIRLSSRIRTPRVSALNLDISTSESQGSTPTTSRSTSPNNTPTTSPNITPTTSSNHTPETSPNITPTTTPTSSPALIRKVVNLNESKTGRTPGKSKTSKGASKSSGGSTRTIGGRWR